jgi:hypothetical protein
MGILYAHLHGHTFIQILSCPNWLFYQIDEIVLKMNGQIQPIRLGQERIPSGYCMSMHMVLTRAQSYQQK